jgi:hypothetical protein
MVVAVALLTAGSAAPRASSGLTSLQVATLDDVTWPAPKSLPLPSPKTTKFTRTIFATSTLERSELMLDFCRGPIAIALDGRDTVLVAEHDYCGGAAWMPTLGKGDAIKLSGEGVRDGTYVVTKIKHALRGHATVRDLPHTDIVLQTCVSTQKMVLVGLERFDPNSATS